MYKSIQKSLWKCTHECGQSCTSTHKRAHKLCASFTQVCIKPCMCMDVQKCKKKIVRCHANGSLTLVQLVLPSKELKNNAACVARELDTKEAVI